MRGRGVALVVSREASTPRGRGLRTVTRIGWDGPRRRGGAFRPSLGMSTPRPAPPSQVPSSHQAPPTAAGLASSRLWLDAAGSLPASQQWGHLTKLCV
ncbi:kinesin-like protein KIFC1 [Nannospalax galili]|uniref:kinesin-like protein KIFC1 n=1 Tax=Nannospalax galili TaxID=1026970 RepID=UPI00111C3ABC|nr:kinesin-like protein KIFC1 [Nannospalax galili]